jgi:hypothetical protein
MTGFLWIIKDNSGNLVAYQKVNEAAIFIAPEQAVLSCLQDLQTVYANGFDPIGKYLLVDKDINLSGVVL